MVEGIDVDDLRKGPGHYPGTPLPGQAGNAAIAGHRTTYGAPFGDLDQLAVGDEIVLTTVQGTFTYRVVRAPFAVSPDDGDVLLPTVDPLVPGAKAATLTLTTCNPKYSAAERLIVKASLVLPPGRGAAPADACREDAADRDRRPRRATTSSRAPGDPLGHHRAARRAARGGGCSTATRAGTTWFVGAIPFLVVLFVFYTYLERLLPSNY